MENHNFNKEKLNFLFIVLGTFMVGNALLAELIGSKVFSINKLFEIGPEGVQIFGLQVFTKDMKMSIGILIWPVVFIISDLVNEYFGRSGMRKISVLAAILIAYASLILIMASVLPPSDVWLNLNGTDSQGNYLDINHAWNLIFRQSVGIIIGSITAFLIGQLIDAYTFHYLRRITGSKMLWLRATGSTVISQIVDSFVILFIAFYLLGPYSIKQVFEIGVVQYAYKIFFAILLTPVIYLVHYLIDWYLGKKESEKIIEQTDKNW